MSSRISKLSIVSLENIDECNAEDVERELEKSLQTFGVPLRQTMIGCCTMSSFVPIKYFTEQMDKSINVPLMDHVPHTNIIKLAINRVQQVFKAWSVRQVRVFKFINAYEFVKVTINRKPVENVTVFDGEPIDPIYRDIDLDDHWDYRSLYSQNNTLSIIPKTIIYYFGSTSRPLELFKLEDESAVSRWNMANGECLALFCDKVRYSVNAMNGN
uniref:Uncharacterized protein n=1 Tax=Clandestinovirus TaxID=2831644 RepID=A0A8F8PQY3_9VIRU|nr:hypothetical protein KOM_12_295 [Clandestinovirus]